MKLVVLFAVVAVAVAQVVEIHPLDSTTPAIQEDLIAKINAGNHGWTAGRNEVFEGMTIADVKERLGAMASEEDFAMFPKAVAEGKDLPDSFDSREAWPKCVFPVRDQGHCGSCWAFGAAETLTDRWCIAGGEPTVMSPEDLVSCDTVMNKGCHGGMLPAAWAWLGTMGIVSDSCFPYTAGEKGEAPGCADTCKDGSEYIRHKVHLTSIRLHSDVQSIKEAIHKGGPCEGAFFVYEDFLQYKTGVYRHTHGKMLGGHAIKIIGWGIENDEEYFLVQNSWSAKWGDQGFFKILNDDCGISGQVMSGDPYV